MSGARVAAVQRQAIAMYLESAPRKTFASAVEWPGWSRSGRDEAGALAALAAYGPRYAEAIREAGLGFRPPAGPDGLRIVGRLTGGAGTDFGVPSVYAPGDEEPVAGAELARLAALVRACWTTFDAAAAAVSAAGLASGPRGGGRKVDKIRTHVAEAEGGYLGRLGWKAPPDPEARRSVILEAMAAVGPLGVPPPGPRGGTRWPVRYFARRLAWHTLDHAWEIRDRTLP